MAKALGMPWSRGAWQARDARLRRVMRGFTLVEILVVIAIVGILIGIIVPSTIILTRQNRRSTCAAHLKAIGQALAIFYSDYGGYPPDQTEYLWTPEAVKAFKAIYPNETIPTDTRLGTLTGAAYIPSTGEPFAPNADTAQYGYTEDTAMHGLGLYTLYYLGSYAEILPPRSVDPRFPRPTDTDYPTDPTDPLRKVDFTKGYKQFGWYRGSGYITELSTLHCPENDATFDTKALTDLRRLPGITTKVRYQEDGEWKERTDFWNNYDQFYRRNYFWNEFLPRVRGAQPYPLDNLTEDEQIEYSSLGATRNLCQAHPPADTVVTWCPYHHRGYIPQYPGDPGDVAHGKAIKPGDYDLVLLIDGSVRRVVAPQDGSVYKTPEGNISWPNDQPVM